MIYWYLKVPEGFLAGNAEVVSWLLLKGMSPPGKVALALCCISLSDSSDICMWGDIHSCSWYRRPSNAPCSFLEGSNSLWFDLTNYVFIFTGFLFEFRQLLFFSVKRRVHFVQGPLMLPCVKMRGRPTHCRLFIWLPSMTMLLTCFSFMTSILMMLLQKMGSKNWIRDCREIFWIAPCPQNVIFLALLDCGGMGMLPNSLFQLQTLAV